MPRVSLSQFQSERDLSILTTWLNQPHVIRWWGAPEQTIAEISGFSNESAALIFADDQPVGFLCWKRPAFSELETAGLTDLPEDLVDVDILIGEPSALGQGIGPVALSQLFEILSNIGVNHIGLATSLANTRAIAAFTKTGLIPFRDFVENAEHYRYFTISLSQPA